MALQLKFFVIPIRGIEQAEAEINRFLRSVRVVNLQREFVAQGDNSFWSMAVEYLANGAGSTAAGKRSRIDYKEVLAPEAFAVFARLREWRKAKAAQEAVPVYTIFTNEQLAQIAEKNVTTKSGLQQIDGIGAGRVKKYGNDVAGIVAQHRQGSGDEKGERSLPADSHL
jgi:superfamily II DNA helicase RecQ